MKNSWPFFIFFFYAFQAHSILIDFKPQSFSGVYQIVGETSQMSGNNTIDLPAGTYSLIIANFSEIIIEIDSGGGITSDNDDAINVSVPQEVTFNNASITVNASELYLGEYQLIGLNSTTVSGTQIYTVVPNLDYSLKIGDLGDTIFGVDETGSVATTTHFYSFLCNGSSLDFSTVPLFINPQSYDGEWEIAGVTSSLQGVQRIDLVKDIEYRMKVGSIGEFTFWMDDTVSPTSISNVNAASAEHNVLKFKNAAINIDPDVGSLDWSIEGVSAEFSSEQRIIIVPGVDYKLVNSVGDTSFSAGPTFNDGTSTITAGGDDYTLTKLSSPVETITLSPLTKTSLNLFNHFLNVSVPDHLLTSGVDTFSVTNVGSNISLTLGGEDLTSSQINMKGLLVQGKNTLVFQVKSTDGTTYVE